MNIHTILEEINLENGSKHKLAVLKKYSDSALLQRVLKMAYDRVSYVYGMSVKHWDIKDESDNPDPSKSLEQVLDFMEQSLATRNVTGNQAIDTMSQHLDCLSMKDRQLILKVLNRDLRLNMGKTLIEKVFPDLIPRPVYMRCGVFGPKTSKDIQFPAIIQLKADGTYREAFVFGGQVSMNTRSGEPYQNPVLEEQLSGLPDGHYIGELLVEGTENRSESNGLINSDNQPYEQIVFHMWDYVTPEEYQNARKKVPNPTTYADRWKALMEILETNNQELNNCSLIESHTVSSLDEALAHTTRWMEQGLEGGVLKDCSGIFKNGTSKHQLKLKLEFVLDLRVTGFQEGTPGTAREKTFGAILFESDDGLIKGRTSGFTDAQLEDFNSRREELIGIIIAVKCNDMTQGRGNEHYALSHPRFDELRLDKTETDSLERALEIKEMAKGL